MHELGVVFHIIRQLETVAGENNLTHIDRVRLRLGEVSTVIPYYLSDCWEFASSKNDLIRGSELKIDTIPAVTHCSDCGRDYPTVEHGRICPYCGSERTWLLQGNEFIIQEIEAQDDG